MKSPSGRLILRDLPLPSRLVLAAFLLSASLGYGAALVNLHFQHAAVGELLPGRDSAAGVFHGRAGVSPLERLIAAAESEPFSGSGSMRQGFTTMSAGWKPVVRKRAREMHVPLAEAEKEVRRERDGEALAVLDWIHAGALQSTFEGDNHPLPAALLRQPITATFLNQDTGGPATVRVATILRERCARCHGEHASNVGSRYPLQTWDEVHDYCTAQAGGAGLSVRKLAQSTHVHLLGLAMLFGLTGLLFTFTSYPGWLRGLVGPLPQLAQVAEVGCWWLTRGDAAWATGIVLTAAAVAAGLGLQIVLSLFDLFGRPGKVIVALSVLAACLGGFFLKGQVIDPLLAREAPPAAAAAQAPR
jgi:hypothetical protein